MKCVVRIFVFCLFASAFSFAQSPFKVVGYYSLDAAIAGFKPSIFKKLTHINLWFLNPDSAVSVEVLTCEVLKTAQFQLSDTSTSSILQHFELQHLSTPFM